MHSSALMGFGRIGAKVQNKCFPNVCLIVEVLTY